MDKQKIDINDMNFFSRIGQLNNLLSNLNLKKSQPKQSTENKESDLSQEEKDYFEEIIDQVVLFEEKTTQNSNFSASEILKELRFELFLKKEGNIDFLRRLLKNKKITKSEFLKIVELFDIKQEQKD